MESTKMQIVFRLVMKVLCLAATIIYSHSGFRTHTFSYYIVEFRPML